MKFKRSHQSSRGKDDAKIIEQIITDFTNDWKILDSKLRILPGKRFLSDINKYLQEEYKTSITNAKIIASCSINDVPVELKELLEKINTFSQK